MKLDLLLELRDSPGQLSAALGVIGRHGGNVVSVLHEHQKKKADFVPVRIVLDVPREGQQPLLRALADEWRLLSVSGATTSHSFAFLLLGHLLVSQFQVFADDVGPHQGFDELANPPATDHEMQPLVNALVNGNR